MAFPAPTAPRSPRRGLRYDFRQSAFDGRLTSQSVVGASYRYVHAIGKESFNSGVIALDRRDISQPAPPNDIIASPFSTVAPGTQALGWENDVRSNTGDAGLFATTDFAWEHGLDLTLGGRYDAYNVRSVDVGVLAYRAGQRARRQRLAHLFRQPELQDRFRPGALSHQRQILRHRDRPGQPGDDFAAGGE